MTLYLASASPRRHDLLVAAGLAPTVRASHVTEIWPEGAATLAAIAVAEQKLRGSWSAWSALAADRAATWLAADTAVVLGQQILGKPKDDAHASATLAALSGKTHEVVTGFVVGLGGEVVWRQAVTTLVTFRSLDAATIARYVASGEPTDKAGAYAVQGLGSALVDRLEGSLTNVVGLPVAEVLQALGRVGNLAAGG